MSTLDEAIQNLETMRDELLKASYTKDNYNSSWGHTLEIISHGLHKYVSQLKNNKERYGDFNHA